jgi:hypothetical protein
LTGVGTIGCGPITLTHASLPRIRYTGVSDSWYAGSWGNQTFCISGNLNEAGQWKYPIIAYSDGNLDISEHNASTIGLKLGGTLVTASAAEINTVADGSTAKNSHNHNGQTLIVSDHGTGSTDQVVNVSYGTSTPPAANTTTIGSLWIKYTA